jgi:hypothetical protein
VLPEIAFERDITQKIVIQELSFLLSPMALFMQMIYSKYKVNRTSTFKVTCIDNIKFQVKVAFERGTNKKIGKQELSFLLSRMAIDNIKFHFKIGGLPATTRL